MKELISKISDSELEVLRVIWEADAEISLSEIRKSLEKTTTWEASTIKTLLRRLCKKEVVLATKKEVLYYKPLVTKEEYNEFSTQSLIDRLYSGSAKNLVASLIGSKRLNDEDVAELRQFFRMERDKNE